jgi:hypothetical protein
MKTSHPSAVRKGMRRKRKVSKQGVKASGCDCEAITIEKPEAFLKCGVSPMVLLRRATAYRLAANGRVSSLAVENHIDAKPLPAI